MDKDIASFYIINKSQKRNYTYREILPEHVLEDVCYKITGQKKFDVVFDDNPSYNKGRLAILDYKGKKYYISFSIHGKVSGRNYFFQSLTTALVKYYADKDTVEGLYFYFLETEGNIETNYYKFMYRLMATAGVNFINHSDSIEYNIIPFISVDDIITMREQNVHHNKSNNPTFITKNEEGVVEVYAKTYGANKKEAVLLALAASRLTDEVLLFEISEQDLITLPKPDKELLESLGNVTIIPSNIKLEIENLKKNAELRSPTFIYNLLEQLGKKKCALCDCKIPELVQGAHIWPVTSIKRLHSISFEDKRMHVNSPFNGLWLCSNHHKLFDENIIIFNNKGHIMIKENINNDDFAYINDITKSKVFNTDISDETLFYLNHRNAAIDQKSNYVSL